MIKQVDYFPDPSQFPDSKVWGIDIETSMRYKKKSSDPFRDDILAIQLSNGSETFMVANPAGMPSINAYLESGEHTTVIHNANFDLQFLMNKLNTRPSKIGMWDSLLIERLMHSGDGVPNGLDDVMARYYGVMLNKDIRDSFAFHEGEFSSEQLTYMEQDVLYLPRLYHDQIKKISELQLGRVAGLECRLTVPVARMSLTGVTVDRELWNTYIPQIQEMLDTIETRLGELSGGHKQMTLDGVEKVTFNIRSTKQLMSLFKRLGLNLTATNKKVREEFIRKYPRHPHRQTIESIGEWKEWSHLLSVPYVEEINPVTSRVHCSWNQIEADTGRFSSSDPNLQNVPRPDDVKPNIRSLFIAPQGYKFLIADYNQQEPRIMAQISGDPAMRKACQSSDVYSGMATELYGRTIVKADPERQLVKTGALLGLYGGGAVTAATELEVSEAEAQEFLNNLYAKFPIARRYAVKTADMVKSTAMTRTLMGRIRYYPEVKEKRSNSFMYHVVNQAVNMPVQGTAADMMKLAIDKFDDVVGERGYDARPCMTIHDELVVECKEEDADEVYYQLLGCFEEAGKELCPDVMMVAEGKIADRWTK